MTIHLTGSFASGALRTILVVSGALLTLIWLAKSVHYRRTSVTYRSKFVPPSSPDYKCPQVEGSNDVLVVVKTNVIDAYKKLPAQLATTLRCVPNLIIFSDIHDVVNGTTIYDALDTVDPEIREKSSDFQLYHQLQQFREEGREVSDIWFDPNDENKEVKALDKWKTLPILEKAQDFHPFAKWFIFVEPETMFFWTNILMWFLAWDANKALYIGEKRNWNGLEYANGGSGFILSSLALENAIQETKKDPKKIEELVKREQSGDRVLGRLMQHIDIKLKNVWPTIQHETPEAINYHAEPTWCTPVATYRADSPTAIMDMWQFEQSHIRYYGLKEPIRHSDIYDFFAAPTIGLEREKWDNLSKDKNITSDGKDSDDAEVKKAFESSSGCRVACSEDEACLQFAFRKGECRLGHTLTVGHSLTEDKSDGYQSGWLLKDIAEAIDFANKCDGSWMYG